MRVYTKFTKRMRLHNEKEKQSRRINVQFHTPLIFNCELFGMASYKGSMRWGVPESCVRCFGQMCLMTSDDEAPSCLSISGKGVYCFAQDSSFRVGYKHKSIVLYPQHPSRYHSPGIGERTSTSTLSVPFDTQSSSLMNYSPALSK